MKPPPFHYFAPSTVPEAVALLAEYGDAAKTLAGGQSLVPLLNMRLAQPEVLVDLNQIHQLGYIQVREDLLCIGALTRHRAVERSEEVRVRCPLLSDAVRHVGHFQIRNRGTTVGSIIHSDPAAEMPVVLTALGGHVTVVGPNGSRAIPAEELFLTYFTTSLETGEIATEVAFRLPNPAAGWSFREVARRPGDFALVGVAVLVEAGADSRCRSVRIALGGVGSTSVRATPAEALLLDQACDEDVLRAAAEAVRAAIEPEDDLHASAEYRRHIAGVLATRGLREAWQRACGGEAS